MIGERFKRLATIVRHLTQMTKRLALPGGIRIRTDDSLAIMTATRNPAEDGVFSPSHQRDPSRSCNGTMDGAGQSAGSTAVAGKPFLGFSTYLIASDLGRYRHYIWRAAALGCADLHFRGDKMDATTGQVISHSEIVALSVQPAEPDPKLFALPTGLKNMGPMEMTSMQASVCCNKRLSDAELSPLQQAEEHFKQFRFDF